MSKKKDITRIEDLGEFLHENDSESDALLENSPPLPEEDDNSDLSFDENEEVSDFQTNNELENDESFDSEPDESEFGPSDNETLGESTSFDDELDTFDTNDQWEDISNEPTESELEDTQGVEAHVEVAEEASEEEEEEEESFEKIEQKTNETEAKETTSQQPIQELNQFATKMTYGQLGKGHGPPFAVLIKNIQGNEVITDILELLKELAVVNDSNFNEHQQRLLKGSTLISQLSEYSAIYLAHQLKKHPVDIKMGLVEEIKTPSSYEREDNAGQSSSNLLHQNKSTFTNQSKAKQEIVVSTADSSQFDVKDFLGTAQCVRIISSDQMQLIPRLDQTEDIEKNEFYKEHLDLYVAMIKELKDQALKKDANMITELKFHISPIQRDDENEHHLFCQGNLVKI